MKGICTVPKLRRFTVFIFILFFCMLQGSAQQTNVTIKIVNAKKQPLTFASVTVTGVRDSMQTFNKVFDSSGIAIFDLHRNEQYIVSVSSVNYATFKKGITVKNDNPVFIFTAENVSRSLKTVTVISTKPVMRQEDDKTIVDPENLAASYTNAYEIIEKLPAYLLTRMEMYTSVLRLLLPST